AVRAGRDAVPAPVADVLLHDDGSELGPEQRTGRADVQAGRVRAVLAHVGRHQPLDAGLLRRPDRRQAEVDRSDFLLDERHVSPRVRAERLGVVVRRSGEGDAVLGKLVPLLAGDLAGLAADAHRRVGEEAHPRRVFAVPGVALDVVERTPESRLAPGPPPPAADTRPRTRSGPDPADPGPAVCRTSPPCPGCTRSGPGSG